jgi:anti-anti-sigma regulatory factor
VFAEIVAEIVQAEGRDVIFDAAGVEFIDSTGFGMLVVAHETAVKTAGGFRVRNASGPFLTLARRVHADHIMKID